MSNRSVGNHFEAEFCEMMAEHGFWAHNMAQNKAGQPADVIAVRDQLAVLVDCKVCEHDTFPLRRVEQNQNTAMDLWKSKGNGTGWFALKLSDGSVWMLSKNEIDSFKSLDFKTVDRDHIVRFSEPFPEWVEAICT